MSSPAPPPAPPPAPLPPPPPTPLTPAAPPAVRAGVPLGAIVDYTLRACLPAKRRIALLLPSLGALLFGLLAHTVNEGSQAEDFAVVAGVGLFSIVLPIGCLVIGDAVLGSELRRGTLHFTWLSPVPRWAIVVGRWLAGTGVAVVTVALPCALAAIVAGAPEAAVPAGVSAAAGCAAYIAVFVFFGAVTRRAVVWSLGFVVLGERLLGAALDGLAQLSPGWLALTAYAGLGPDAEDLLRSGVPDGWSAVIRLAFLTAVMLWIASWRLGRLRVTGRAD